MLTYFILDDKKKDIKDRIDMSMSRVENCVASPSFNPELLAKVIKNETKNVDLSGDSSDCFAELDEFVKSRVETMDFMSLVNNSNDLQFENLNYPAVGIRLF